MIDLSPRMEEHRIHLDGVAVHYTERGPADAALTLVGVNGLAGGGDSFWPLLGGVPDDVRVVLPDIPGCGESGPLPEAHNIDAYVAWLHRFLDQTRVGRVALISVATGAPVTIRYARLHPDRTAGLIFSLPFLGRIAIPPWLRPIAAYTLRVPALASLVDALRQSDELMHRIITHEPPEAIPELAERDIDHKQQASLRAAGELLHDLMLMDSRTEMRAMHTPMLFLAAEHDAYSPLPVLQGIVRNHSERRLFIKWGAPHSWNEAFIQDMQDQIRLFLTELAEE
ncbi:MAG TPA: alpha/beta hydrolase [Chloroflexia bacterium]|nr:alpha/beta hydrolase [Chloroflexia bacterium]